MSELTNSLANSLAQVLIKARPSLLRVRNKIALNFFNILHMGILSICLVTAIAAKGETLSTSELNQAVSAPPTGPTHRTKVPADAIATLPPATAIQESDTSKREAYKFYMGDRIKVLFYGRDDIPKEYRVNDEGRVSIPTLGAFDASGHTAQELEKDLLDALERATKQIGFVSVEVLERRPVLVTGLVAKSGSYPYSPDMTVIHATAIAGGTMSTAIAPWLPTDALREISRKRTSEEELKRLLATQVRLIASRDEKTEVTASRALIEIAGKEQADELVRAQKEILDRERLSNIAQKSSLEATIRESQKEIAAYDQELDNILQQRSLRKAMSERLQSLTRKGLTTQQRVSDAEFLLISLDRDAQGAIANQARARQGLERAERDLTLLTHDRRIQVEKSLQTADEQIAKTRAAIEGSIRIISHISGLPAQLLTGDQEPQFQFEILRKGRPDGGFMIIQATETTPIKPGDVLRVSALRQSAIAAR